MHIKRITIPQKWPFPKKEHKFIVSPNPGKVREESLALAVVLRDLLKEVKTFNEAKKVIRSGDIEINCKIVKDEKLPISLFDRIFIKKINKYFTLHLSKKGKLEVKEIDSKIYSQKPYKIIGKRVLKGNKNQLNFYNGENLLVNKNDFKTGESVIINLKDKKIEKVLHLTDGSFVLVTKGKTAGKTGKIKEIKDNKAIVDLEKEKKEVLIKNLIVIEENEFK